MCVYQASPNYPAIVIWLAGSSLTDPTLVHYVVTRGAGECASQLSSEEGKRIHRVENGCWKLPKNVEFIVRPEPLHFVGAFEAGTVRNSL